MHNFHISIHFAPHNQTLHMNTMPCHIHIIQFTYKFTNYFTFIKLQLES